MSIAETTVTYEHRTDYYDGLHIIKDPSHPLWNQAEKIEAEVFVRKKYVENALELRGEYAKYLEQSEMLAACVGGEAVGAIRFISYNPLIGLKTIDDIYKGRLLIDEKGREILDAVNPCTVVEIGTIAVREDYRKQSTEDTSALIFRMYGAILRKANLDGTPNVLASFDQEYLDGFASLFGPSVKILGPSEEYMGSKTAPVIMNVNDIMEYLYNSGYDELADYIASSDYSVHDKIV